MMKSRYSTMILLVSFVYLIAGGFVCSAQQNSVEKYADAVYEQIKHEYILNPDGSTTYNYEHRLRFITYFAFNRAYGESFIVYNPTWQTLQVTKAETRMADGTIVKAPFNAFNEVLPGFAANSAPYLNIKEMVVTHTGLERNAVVTFAYTITTKPGMYPGLVGKVLVGDRSPVNNASIQIRIPKDKELRWNMLHSAITPQETIEGAWKSYAWTIEKTPMMPVESNQPPMDQYLPFLMFSTAGPADVVQHVLGRDGKAFTVNAKIKSVVEEVCKSSSTPLDKAFALRRYVETNVAQMNGDLLFLGYKSLTAQQTFDRNVGSQLDRAILLAAMCEAAGVRAVPVLISEYVDAQVPGALKTASAPAIPLFSSPAVMCPGIGRNGAEVLLDANGPQLKEVPARFIGKPYLVLNQSDNRFRDPLKLSTNNAVTLSINGVINSDGDFAGDGSILSNGIFACENDSTRLITLMKSAFSKCGQGTTVSDWHVIPEAENRMRGNITMLSKSSLASSDGIVKFTIPQAPGGVSDLHLILADTVRNTPFELGRVFEESQQISIQYPADWSLIRVRKSVDLLNDVGELRINVQNSNGSFIVKRSLRFRQGRIPPESYKDFCALLDAWLDPAYSTLYFVKKDK